VTHLSLFAFIVLVLRAIVIVLCLQPTIVVFRYLPADMRPLLLATLVLVTSRCHAFTPLTNSACSVRHLLSLAAAIVELEPEPAGGTELSSSTSIAGCRMKQLDEPATVASEGAFKFWMTAQAEGKLIEEIRAKILKDASKKANFPGFRKVC
jgi:hypothetical protein